MLIDWFGCATVLRLHAAADCIDACVAFLFQCQWVDLCTVRSDKAKVAVTYFLCVTWFYTNLFVVGCKVVILL
jgi:hypothetical protein